MEILSLSGLRQSILKRVPCKRLVCMGVAPPLEGFQIILFTSPSRIVFIFYWAIQNKSEFDFVLIIFNESVLPVVSETTSPYSILKKHFENNFGDC